MTRTVALQNRFSQKGVEIFLRPSDYIFQPVAFESLGSLNSSGSGFVSANLPTFAELCLAADEKLFETVIRDNNHVLGLHKFLPSQSEAFNTTIFDNADITFLSLRELVI